MSADRQKELQRQFYHDYFQIPHMYKTYHESISYTYLYNWK